MTNAEKLISLANQYETADFINGDPSWFMHQVEGKENKEITAFVASVLSYGSRKQFMPKIQYMLDCANGNVYEWVRSGSFNNDIPSDTTCYYRLYNRMAVNKFLSATRTMLNEYESIGKYIKDNATTGIEAVKAITKWYSINDSGNVIPKDASSACKRICMFLRWMVRDNSPVDLGLWSSFIDKRTLIMPMDTHVVQESIKLELIKSKSTSMSNAINLTKTLSNIFPDDPLKGDFALFGYGVNK